MPFAALLCAVLSATTVEPSVGVYTPIDGGWQIRITGDAQAARPEPGSQIGVVEGDYRQHRRPLYPPADRTLVWTPEEIAQMPRVSFRPAMIAYNEPRFLLDFHAAGGLLGHLYIGMTQGGASKWFHQWSEIDVEYSKGRMLYTLNDPEFPGVLVELRATALSAAAGLIVRVNIEGGGPEASFVWGYGGASAYFTNYAMDATEFRFAPEQCAKDRWRFEKDYFTLRRAFDKSDVVTNEIFSAWRKMPDWEAVIRAGSERAVHVRRGFGDPMAFDTSPAALTASAAWQDSPAEKTNCVVVHRTDINTAEFKDIVCVGMGEAIKNVLTNPILCMAAQARNIEIAERVRIRTPDPHLNAAAQMMALATDGTWGDIATVHGGWSWRFAYLGWRTCYGPMVYGWEERVKKYVENHATMGVVQDGPDKGAIGSMLEYDPGVFYNMNEVYFDHVRQYFDYTNDLELMRKIFPVLQGILRWEEARLQPGNADLFESALNTWISDSHWYIGGQCAQASAYMLNANYFVADLARRLGEDPKPYQEKAARIRKAMQDTLWMPREGVFAEYRDTRGNQLLHPEPELPTIYHSAEFGAADDLQIYQMLHWADTHLVSKETAGGGKLVWSSNWYPNNGRSYTHSTHEMAYGEELNLALTNYQVGRADEAYALIRATLCGIFNGPTPGGLSCHAWDDGRQRANDEFADAISMWGRALVEGMFGIVPKRPDGYIEVTPQFPSDWNDASIQTRHFGYSWKRTAETIEITWNAPEETAVHFRVPVPLGNVECDLPVQFETGFDGQCIALVNTEAAKEGRLVLRIAPGNANLRIGADPRSLKQGETLTVAFNNLPVQEVADPQNILRDEQVQQGVLTGIIDAKPGPALVFAKVGEGDASSWIPVKLNVLSAEPEAPKKVWSVPEAVKNGAAQWALVDLGGVYNDSVVEAPMHVQETAPAPDAAFSQVNFNYWKDHFRDSHHGGRIEMLSDAAWRAKVGADGVAVTRDGIPFKTAKEGQNIAIVTVTGGYPAKVSFPVNAAGTTLYLMISGVTFPNQSHVPHLRVTLHYADGSATAKELVSPFDINDCWATWCGRWHDCAANGFENLGGRHGVAGSADVPDMTQPVQTDTEAHLVPFELKPGVELASVDFECVANDIIYGIMGATILK